MYVCVYVWEKVEDGLIDYGFFFRRCFLEGASEKKATINRDYIYMYS